MKYNCLPLSHRAKATSTLPRQCRAAFTLVELLVVIAIISVFIAMMLPAVQASRETARRNECINNLSQLMFATQHYQSAHEYYPPGVIDDHGPIHSEPSGKHQNWIIQLLPYMEELPKYKHIAKTESVYADANAPVRKLAVTLLQCPSDWRDDLALGVSNYAACHHDVEAPIDVDNHGVFFLNSRIRYEDITDGASHTIFIGEKIAEPNDLGWMSGTRADLAQHRLATERRRVSFCASKWRRPIDRATRHAAGGRKRRSVATCRCVGCRCGSPDRLQFRTRHGSRR